MKIKNYETVTNKTIMEVKMYLLIIGDGYYQNDLHDIINTSIDNYQLKKQLNKRKDIQVWLFTKIKRLIDNAKTYDEIERHLVYLNIIFDDNFKPLIDYKYNFFNLIINNKEFDVDSYCLTRHLINFNYHNLDNYLSWVINQYNYSEYQYHHLASEILLLEKQYKQAYNHLPYIDLDDSLLRYQKALWNYSPRKYDRLQTNNQLINKLAY